MDLKGEDRGIKVTPRSDGWFVVLPTEAGNKCKRLRRMRVLGMDEGQMTLCTTGQFLEVITREGVRHGI